MPQPTPTPSRPPTNLPEPVSNLIGRDAELDEILNLSTSHRLVTLAGAGGIGKTRLGFEVARHLLPRFAAGNKGDHYQSRAATSRGGVGLPRTVARGADGR